MNSLVKTIQEAVEKSVSQSIQTLFEKICDKWEDIDINELQAIWNEDNSIQVATKKINKTTDKKVKETTKTTEKENTKEVDSEGGCPYVFAKGEKEGSICGSKPKTGCEYCSRHQKFEGIGQDIKKKLPKAKAQGNNSISEKASSAKKAKSPPKKSIERVIKLNKDIDKYWNAETQLVFKSKDERVVYASYKDEKLEELNDDDVMLCEQYGFKYQKGPINEEIEEDDNVEVDVKEVKIENENKVEKKEDKKKVNKKEEIKVEKVNKKEEIKVEKVNKKEEIKVDKKLEKKSLSNAIDESNLKAKDIENVLNELQLSNDDDNDDDEFIEEEFEEEEEEY